MCTTAENTNLSTRCLVLTGECRLNKNKSYKKNATAVRDGVTSVGGNLFLLCKYTKKKVFWSYFDISIPFVITEFSCNSSLISERKITVHTCNIVNGANLVFNNDS